MKSLGYLALRKQIFVGELKHMLRQIEHLLLFAVFFLGTAIPALLFISLLAFGVVLDNNSSTTLLLLIVWGLVVCQSILLLLTKQAILGSRYHYFLVSLERGRAKRLFADTILTIICNPILLLYLFVLASISPAHWLEISHGILLLLLLVVGNLICIYKPQGLYWFLAATLCSIPILSSQDFVFALMVFCLLQLLIITLFTIRKSISYSLPFSIPIEWMFWLSLSLGSHAGVNQTSARGRRPNSLLSAAAIATLFIILTYYCSQQLPNYLLSVHFIGAQLVVLSTASMQLSVRKIINTYPLFFANYLSYPAISKRQYWVSIFTSFILLFIASIALNSIVILFHMMSALICIYSANRLPKYFIFAWLISSCLLGILLFHLF